MIFLEIWACFNWIRARRIEKIGKKRIIREGTNLLKSGKSGIGWKIPGICDQSGMSVVARSTNSRNTAQPRWSAVGWFSLVCLRMSYMKYKAMLCMIHKSPPVVEMEPFLDNNAGNKRNFGVDG